MRLYILLLLTLLSQQLVAQNDWFLPFGSQIEAVRNTLVKKGYFKNIKEDSSLQRIIAQTKDGSRIEYVFKKGNLFATSLRREIIGARLWRSRIKSCLEYLQLVSNNQVHKSSTDGVITYTAQTANGTLKLYVLPKSQDKKYRILQLTSVGNGQEIAPDTFSKSH